MAHDRKLGDILLQVLLHASIGKEGYMDIQEIIESLSAKMIRRHPYFGDEKAASIEELNDIWQTAKSKEGKSTTS